MKRIIISLFLGLLTGVLSAQEEGELFQTFNQVKDDANTRLKPIKNEKGVGYKPHKRWEYEEMFHSYPSGRLDSERPNPFNEFNNYKSTQLGVHDHNGDWTPFGSGDGYSTPNIGGDAGYSGGVGRINCVAVNPTNPSELLAGAPAGGLWKSTNGGDDWFSVSDGIPSVGISEIVYDHSNSNIIYLNTGDGDGRQARGAGILKSMDGGDTWFIPGPIPDQDNWYGYDLEMHATNPNILVACSRWGLYASYDAAESWTELRNARYFDIEFSLDDPDIFYGAYGNGVRAFEYDGVEFVELYAQSLFAGADRVELEVTADAPEKVFAVVGDNDNGFRGFFESPDGTSWVNQSNTPNILLGQLSPGNGSGSSQAWYDLAMVIDPTDEDDVLIGAINIWGKSGNGYNWDIKTFWNYAPENNDPGHDYVHADIHDLIIENGIVYASCDGGIFKSSDFGETWDDISSGLVISQPYRIDSHANTSYNVVGGCQDIGMNMYNSDPDLEHLLGGDGMGAVYDDGNSSNLYATKQEGNLFYSTDGGWTYIDYANPEGPFYTHFILNPTDPNDKYFGGEFGLWRELNGGGWGGSPITNVIDTIVYVAQGVDDPNVVYAAEMGNIIKSENAWSANPSWVIITNNLPANTAPLRGIGVDPTDSDHVWVTYRGWVDVDKVYESFDGGSTWNNRTENLPNFPVHCVVVDPNDPNGTYIGTDIGVFYRNTYTDGWMWFSNGLPVVPVYDINMMMSEGKMRVATFGRGVWESPVYDVCSVSILLTTGNDESPVDGYSGQQHHEAGYSIVSTRIVEGGEGVDVHYQAGEYIRLEAGFEVKENCLFNAVVAPCNGSAPPLIVEPNTEEQ